jgi:hypothetical protein
LFDVWAVSSGALVVGTPDAGTGMSSDGLLEFVMPLCGVATQPDSRRAAGSASASASAARRTRPTDDC